MNKLLLSDPAIRALFDQVVVLTRLLLTIPASSAEAERSFSALRRLKTYLRSTMSQQRLNSIAILNVHQHRLDALNIRKIACEFVQENEQSGAIFGRIQDL